MDENTMVNNEYEETEIATVDPEVTDEIAEVDSNFDFMKAGICIGVGVLLAEGGRFLFRKVKTRIKDKRKNRSVEVTEELSNDESIDVEFVSSEDDDYPNKR